LPASCRFSSSLHCTVPLAVSRPRVSRSTAPRWLACLSPASTLETAARAAAPSRLDQANSRSHTSFEATRYVKDRLAPTKVGLRGAGKGSESGRLVKPLVEFFMSSIRRATSAP
jgi:hypothetical protein